MTPEIALVLVILGIAIVLFATERIRVDVISMMVLLSLILTGLLTVEEAFSVFSNYSNLTFAKTTYSIILLNRPKYSTPLVHVSDLNHSDLNYTP